MLQQMEMHEQYNSVMFNLASSLDKISNSIAAFSTVMGSDDGDEVVGGVGQDAL